MTQHIFFALILILSSNAFAKLENTSNELRMKNPEIVANYVSKRIKKAADIQASQKDEDTTDGISVLPEATDQLKDGMRVTFSLPDSRDGACTKLFAQLRRELADLNSFDKTFESLADEAIGHAKNPPSKDAKPVERNTYFTYVYILHNMVSEMKPEIDTMPVFKKVMEKIRDAKIEFSDKLISRYKMDHGIAPPKSPSDEAKEFLKSKK